MKGQNRGGVFIGIAIALLMFVSTGVGYKFVTAVNPEVDQKFNEVAMDKLGIDLTKNRKPEVPDPDEKVVDLTDPDDKTVTDVVGDNPSSYEQVVQTQPYTYKSQSTRNYTGTTISTAGCYIYNSNGKVIDEFYEDDLYQLALSMDVDRSEAVFLDETTLYYLDADLNMTVIEENVQSAGMCYEGGFFYYTKSGGDFMRDIYIYDVEKGEATKVGETTIDNVAISPDGQTVAYFHYRAVKELCVSSIGGEPIVLKSNQRISPIAVSNTGDTVFYESMDESDGVYCYYRGKDTKISKEYAYTCFFDRDCREIFFEEPGKIKYYKAGDKSTITLFDSSYMNYTICNTSYQKPSRYYNHYIVDTDCLSDVLLIDDYSNYYALKGETPVVFPVATSDKAMYGINAAITANGPASYYTNDSILYRADYDGTNMVPTAVTVENQYVNYKTASKDLKDLWYTLYNDNHIYYKAEGQEPVPVAEGVTGILFNLQWNPLDGKCYYIKEKKLYSVGTTAGSEEAYDIDVDTFSFARGDDEVLCIEGTDNQEYILLFGRIYKYH
ncbi:hypothetical protein D6855_13780 [Butyrivibrio sp. CB08]|uniref:hypothetical protein n=1 Tax=Butyrivibrio sp. CB08 TaxID=2364879 RepID=UPI000EA97C6F|nr:hypothetical protein [Butyrivibrio sp. CB08]RKM57609.1 hypothetical protein D6855_13780 [Butyrivibrio sp. CB08]